jgi:hypothetical protein
LVGEDKAGNKPVNIGRAGDAQRNVSCLPVGAGFHDGLGPLRLVKDPARLIGQERPRSGELHAERLATEERRVHFPLELTDMQAEGRLFDREPFRCTDENSSFATATK